MSETNASKSQNLIPLVLLSAVGTVTLILGMAVFVQYRVHTTGLAL